MFTKLDKSIKLVISSALALSLLIMPLAQVGALLAPPEAFNDVAESHKNATAISYVRAAGIVNGYDDGSFQPARKILRSEFTKIIIEAITDKEEINKCLDSVKDQQFKDVPKTQWFAKYVCVAKKKGIIDGYKDGTFRPGNKIAFTEAAKIIAIGFGHKTKAQVEGEQWFTQFVQYLESKNSIPTSVAKFDHKVTRAEMAEMIYRIRAKIANKESKTYNELAGIKKETPKAEAKTEQPTTYKGKVLAGDKAKLLEFNKEDYQAAVKQNKTILLYFYATWCPICQKGIKSKEEAFNKLEDDQYIGFRVNYKDSDTDADEEKLASDYAVGFQSTTVIVKNGEVKMKSTTHLNADKVIAELEKAAK